MEKIPIIAGAVLLLAALVVLLILKKKRRSEKEAMYEADRKRKEAELKHSLENPDLAEGSGDAYRPLKVSYTTEASKSGKSVPFLSLLEVRGNVKKKYIFSADQPVFIGLQYGVPVISNGKDSMEYICQIYYSGMFCVRSVGKDNLIVRRGRDSAYVDHNGIQLNDKDVIMAGDSEFHIMFI